VLVAVSTALLPLVRVIEPGAWIVGSFAIIVLVLATGYTARRFGLPPLAVSLIGLGVWVVTITAVFARGSALLGVIPMPATFRDVPLLIDAAMTQAMAETTVRITGDCPLIDPIVIDAALREHAGYVGGGGFVPDFSDLDGLLEVVQEQLASLDSEAAVIAFGSHTLAVDTAPLGDRRPEFVAALRTRLGEIRFGAMKQPELHAEAVRLGLDFDNKKKRTLVPLLVAHFVTHPGAGA